MKRLKINKKHIKTIVIFTVLLYLILPAKSSWLLIYWQFDIVLP